MVAADVEIVTGTERGAAIVLFAADVDEAVCSVADPAHADATNAKTATTMPVGRILMIACSQKSEMEP